MNELEERIKSVAVRRAWVNQKFGKCKGKGEGCEKGITRTDLRPLQMTWYIPGLGRTTSLDIFGGTAKETKKTEKMPVKRNASIKCRHCGGGHLTARCPNRNSAGDNPATASRQNLLKTTAPVQSYYLGPPPGRESNPLDFEDSESEAEGHQLAHEAISATVQSYAQGNQPGEEVTALLNKILHHNHTQRENAYRNPNVSMNQSYQTPSAPPRTNTRLPINNRKWNNSRRGVEDYNKDNRLNFRKRKTLPPALAQTPTILRGMN